MIVLLFLLNANAYYEEQKIYRNSYFNFTVNYPASWKVQETRVGAIFISPPINNESSSFAENVDISVNEIGNNSINAKSYLEKSIKDLQSSKDMRNFKVFETGESKIGDKKAVFVSYSGILWGNSFKCKQYVIIEGSILYLLTYYGEGEDFYKFLPQAESIIKSFRLEE